MRVFHLNDKMEATASEWTLLQRASCATSARFTTTGSGRFKPRTPASTRNCAEIHRTHPNYKRDAIFTRTDWTRYIQWHVNALVHASSRRVCAATPASWVPLDRARRALATDVGCGRFRRVGTQWRACKPDTIGEESRWVKLRKQLIELCRVELRGPRLLRTHARTVCVLGYAKYIRYETYGASLCVPRICEAAFACV